MTDKLRRGTPVIVTVEAEVDADTRGSGEGSLFLRVKGNHRDVSLLRASAIKSIEVLGPECNYGQHSRFGNGRAEYQLVLESPMVCGCPVPANPRLLCTGCMARRFDAGHTTCVRCGHRSPVWSDVISLTRIAS